MNYEYYDYDNKRLRQTYRRIKRLFASAGLGHLIEKRLKKDAWRLGRLEKWLETSEPGQAFQAWVNGSKACFSREEFARIDHALSQVPSFTQLMHIYPEGLTYHPISDTPTLPLSALAEQGRLALNQETKQRNSAPQMKPSSSPPTGKMQFLPADPKPSRNSSYESPAPPVPSKQALEGMYETYRYLFTKLNRDVLPPLEQFEATYAERLEEWFSTPDGQAFEAWTTGKNDHISEQALQRVYKFLEHARKELPSVQPPPDQSNDAHKALVGAMDALDKQVSAEQTKKTTSDRTSQTKKTLIEPRVRPGNASLAMKWAAYDQLFSKLNDKVLPPWKDFTLQDAQRIEDWLKTRYGKAFESWATGEKLSLSKIEYDTIERDLWFIKSGKAPLKLPAIEALPLQNLTLMERPLLLGIKKFLPERALDPPSLQAYFQPDDVLLSRYFDLPLVSPSKSKPSTPKPVKKVAVTPSPNPPQDQKRTAPEQGPPKNLVNMPLSFGALSKMPGLGPVKEAIHAQVSLAMVNKMRAAAGGKQIDTTRHMVFRGNPGTGKTEVARLIGKIFHEIGVLTKGHCIEVDRGDLVSKWIGGTAEDTDRMFKQAFGGVLFIDEAYSLTPEDPGRDSGKESIDKLLKMMEDHRNDLIVIAAGYQKEMDRFLDSNPGLRSRFAVTIDFPDYDVSEMVEIFLLMCEKDDFKLSPDAKTKLREVLQAVHKRRGVQFGNGRAVRNLLDDCVKRHAVRVAEQENPSYSTLTTFTAEDIPIQQGLK